MKLEHHLTPYTKINSKWIKDLNVRLDTIKLLEENRGKKTLFDINHRKILLDPPPRVMKMKTKINKWDLMKFKNFCTAKETINKMKRQPSEWEKIFANETMEKELISKLYKQLMELNNRKPNNRIKIGQKTEIYISPGIHTDCQQVHEKMLNITNQGNENQNYNEILPHTC